MSVPCVMRFVSDTGPPFNVSYPRQCSPEVFLLFLRYSRLMTTVTSKIATWYGNAAAFNVENLFSRKKEAGPRRTVFVNENIADDYRDHRGRVKPEHVYSTNQVITSKYTIITFVPRNLLEQFRRIANMSVMLKEFRSYSLLILYLRFNTQLLSRHRYSPVLPGICNHFPRLSYLSPPHRRGYHSRQRRI
jgi:hypothetical protein